MIAKAIKGKGFRGAVAYDLQKGKSVLLDSNMSAKEKGSVNAFAKEFGAVRALRPQLKKAVCHVSISLHPDENLSDSDWCKVAQTWLNDMGFTDNQYIVSRHTDTKHPHIHILVNRIRLDGSVVSDSHDYKRQEAVMRKLEKEFGLIQVKNSKEVKKSSPKKGELEQAIRRQEPSVRMMLQEIISNTLQKPMPLQEFVAKLQENNVEVKLNQASTGTISGISFSLNGVSFKGSKLGKGFTWNALKQKGLYYENGYVTRYEPNSNADRQNTIETNNINGTISSSGSGETASTLERAGDNGIAAGPLEPAGESETAKQSRIAENFARLEKEFHRDRQRPEKTLKRNTGLSR